MSLFNPASSPVLMPGGLVVWENLFSKAELDAIEQHADRLGQERAELAAKGTGLDSIRVTRVAWLMRDAQTESFYARMEEVVLRLNAQFFRYDLSGVVTFQYAVYDGAEGGHFDWHKDYGKGYDAAAQEPRKLSISIQLSDSADYQGCDLEVRAGNLTDVAPRTRGAVIAFPSYVLHRVTPITSGVRKSLVVWAVGPEFK
ncbi:MAG: 2OG-Fe(II) oxygenase [Pseudomonadota bacterium]